MPKRDVAVRLDIGVLRDQLGLTREQLPDGASDDYISGVLNAVEHNAQAARARLGPGAAAALPGGQSYDPAWLSPQERARLEAAQEGRQHSTIVHET